MPNPAKLTLENTRTSLVLYAVVMVLGVQSYLTIGRLEYPEFTIRSAQIITPYPGRTALQVEQEVTEPLEQAIRQMPEVHEVKSTSKSGLSIVAVELDETIFDLAPIWQRLRNKVAETRLPQGASEPSVNDEFGDVFPYLYALRGDGYSYRELLDHAEDIRDELLKLPGIGKVEFHGQQEERVFVDFSSSELAALGIPPVLVAQTISNYNAIASSGAVTLGDERISVATLGEFESIDEIAALRLTVPGEVSTVRLSDIAEIRRGYKDPVGKIAHYNGERVICIAISMVLGGSVTELGARLDARLREIESELPLGLDIEQQFFQPEYVNKSISDFIVNLAQAFGFVAIVMFFFAGWRIALVVAVLVPSAVCACFLGMPWLGVQLEMMSIAALIIALGLLVDNAVVVSEQILVRLGDGATPRLACIESVKNLTIPLLAASGTTIAAFSPIALSPGGTSEFTYSLFAVVSLTLVSSWILSVTIIPLFCFYFLKPLKRDTLVGRALRKLYSPYEGLLRFSLKHRVLFLVVVVTLMVLAVWGFRFVPSIFFPPNERGQLTIDFELPLGKDIGETESQVTELERWLRETQSSKVRSVSSWIGFGGPRWYLALSPEPPNPNYAFLSVLTQDSAPDKVRAFIDEINDHAKDAFPDARVTAKTLENGPPVGDPIQIRLYGSDLNALYQCRDRIVDALRPIDGVFDIRDNWGTWVKQASVNPDPVRLARLGLTTVDVADALSLQYQGMTATSFREGENSTPVVLRSREDYRERPERMPDLPIHAIDGSSVPVGQVASVDIEFLPGSILREDTLRAMTIKAGVRGRFASSVLAEIRPKIVELLAQSDWPSGYSIEIGGMQEESGEAQGKIFSVMPVAMAILSLILISQFNSIRRFLIILITIPPMIVGITPGLLLTGSTFGFMTLLGMIALLGIIVNNAILLIDEIDQQRKAGLPKREAIVASAKSRLRPILMTTITTIIGLLPLAISGGGMWSSMANAMMFGLGFATTLTLILCPVLFDLFFPASESAGEAASATPADVVDQE